MMYYQEILTVFVISDITFSATSMSKVSHCAVEICPQKFGINLI